MGYYIRSGLVKQNLKELELIIQVVVKRGKELRWKVNKGDIYKTQYQLRRILKAAEIFPEEAGEGKYSDLSGAVTVSVDAEGSQLIIKPKSVGSGLHRHEEDEVDAIRTFTSAPPSSEVQTTTFKPSDSFSVEEFTSILSSEGWEIVMLDPIGEGMFLVTAEREATPGAMEALGFRSNRGVQ